MELVRKRERVTVFLVYEPTTQGDHNRLKNPSNSSNFELCGRELPHDYASTFFYEVNDSILQFEVSGTKIALSARILVFGFECLRSCNASILSSIILRPDAARSPLTRILSNPVESKAFGENLEGLDFGLGNI